MGKTNVTIADVAKLAQVSKMSVSRALSGQSGVSNETRRRILEVARQLGYDRVENTRTIALLVPQVNSTYVGEILRGITETAERLNYGLMLYTQRSIDHTQRTSDYLLRNNLVEGVILLIPREFELLVRELKDHALAYVIIDPHSGNISNEPCVTATNRKGVVEAMRHLLALGHQRIGFITGSLDVACAHERLRGYRDALEEVGLDYDPILIREGNFSQGLGFQQAQALFELEQPPTAIMASNDLSAFGAMDAAKAAGYTIGQDLSIVGFDDEPMASQTYPPLTTVRQPMALMGEVGLEMLVNLIEQRTVLNLQRELPTELIIRESTGRVPA